MKKNLPLSYIEISKKNLIHNIHAIKSLGKKGLKLSVALKGNAYGHGQNLVAQVIQKKVDYIQLDSVEELRTLRAISNKNVFLFGYVQEKDLKEVIKLKTIISAFSLEELKNINNIAKKLKIIQQIHLPIDAYLGREGFLKKDIPTVLREIKKCKNIKLTGVYAHFANIEDTGDFSHAKLQIKDFEETLEIIRKSGFDNFLTHISATSGFLVYEKTKGIHPLVRLGIGVYGLWPSRNIEKLYKGKISLKPVLSWKTKIAQIKILPKGRTIGYGLTYKTKKDIKIGLIPQGYADGYPRALSNKGEVLIKGQKCKILGRVMMNMFVVDLSHIKNVRLEDEVVLIGEQGGKRISAEDLASKLGTINYEITTRISPLLPRILG